MLSRVPTPLDGLLCALLLASTVSAQSPDTELRAREEALAAALIKKDRTAFEQILAPEFLLRGAPDVTRDTWIRNALSMCWGSSYDIGDFAVVRAMGDTAVVSLVLTTLEDPATCEPAIIRSLLTDVWVLRDGVYRLLLRHSGPAGAGIAAQFAKTAPPPPRWERTAELSLVATGGNTDTQTLGAGGSLIWRPAGWETRGRAAFVRSVADDDVTAESFVAEIRQSRKLSTRAEAFGRADYLVNRFAGIAHRTTIDGGIGWTIRETDARTLKVDGGLGVTYESRLTAEDQTFGAGTAGALLRWRLSRTTHIEERAALWIDLASAENWRVQNTAAVSVSMIRKLSLKVSHDLKHVAQPVAGFRKADTILSATLVARF